MKENYKGFTIKIAQDEFPPNPRLEYDNMSTMILLHPNYDLGDLSDSKEDRNKRRYYIDIVKERGWDALRKVLEKEYGVSPLLRRVRLYDHSGISIAAGLDAYTYPYNDRWDSMAVGWVFIPQSRLDDEYGDLSLEEKLERGGRVLDGEVNEYNQYLTGDVWYFQIKNAQGDVLESVGGYFGQEYALEEARTIIDGIVDQNEKAEVSLEGIRIWECPICEVENRTREPQVDVVTCGACAGVFRVQGVQPQLI